MALIFINRFFHPDHSATSQILTDLTFALAARGHEITVLTSRQLYDDEQARLPARDTVANVRIIRLWTTRFGRVGLVGRAVDYLTFYVSLVFALLIHVHRGDVVIAKTDPPMLSVLVVPLARMKGARVVNWLQDLFPEVATALGMAQGRVAGAGVSVLQRLRDMTLRRADSNVAIGQRMAARVAKLGVAASRLRIIPNWSVGGAIEPVAPEDNPLRRAWGLDGAFVVGYSGNLGRAHDFETFLAAILLLEADAAKTKIAARADRPCLRADQADVATPDGAGRPVTWLFIGAGAGMVELKKAVADRGLLSVVFQPYQPLDQLSQSLSAADVHLVSLRPAMEGLIVPSKYYGVAAAARATIFIGDAQGEIGVTLARCDGGITVAEGDGAALALAIRGLADTPRRCRAMGERAREDFQREFDQALAIDRWEAVIRDVTAQRTP